MTLKRLVSAMWVVGLLSVPGPVWAQPETTPPSAGPDTPRKAPGADRLREAGGPALILVSDAELDPATPSR